MLFKVVGWLGGVKSRERERERERENIVMVWRGGDVVGGG